MYQAVFKRYEIKYLLSKEQTERLKVLLSEHMEKDKYAHSVIRNIYYDTDDFLLIRRSLEKPQYKEKIRLRSYGEDAFVELKKKYDSVVYKRRLRIPTEEEAKDCLAGKQDFPDTQIGRELAYCLVRYPSLAPKFFLSYEREAYKDGELRVTLDENILWREDDFSLQKIYGTPILNEGSLLEIKTSRAIPLWLVSFLSEEKIYKISFSKVGKAYETMLARRNHV